LLVWQTFTDCNRSHDTIAGLASVLAKTDGMTKVLECVREVLGLGPRQSAIVGPLAIPIDAPTSEGNQAKKSEAADEKPPQ
jgi:hypothetical protein